jgi:cardiolipin synthase C
VKVPFTRIQYLSRLALFTLLVVQTPLARAAQAPETLLTTITNAATLPTPPIQEGDLRFNATFDTKYGVPQHKLVLLEDGPAALQARLWMIEHAQKEVDIESYIFTTDNVGKILLQALIRRKDELKREGKELKVRILIDHLTFAEPGISRLLVQELAKHEIQVKYYNESLAPWKVDLRNHKKTFLVDGKHFITGGRNLSDSYFGMDPKYNYLDTDVYVQGWAAGAAQGAFNDFWNSDLSATPGVPAAQSPDKIREAQAALAPSTALQNILAQVQAKGTRELNDLYVFPANSVVYLSDKPFNEDHSRRTMNWLMRDISEAKNRVLMENWTFVPDGRSDVFKNLLKRGVSVELMTNSYESKDNALVYLSYPRQRNFVKKDMNISGYSGKPTDDPGLTARNNQGATWGTHAKTACIDDRSCFVGSANLDPRSDDRNAETGIMVYDNPPFAVAVESGIRRRMLDARRLGTQGRYQNTPYAQIHGECAHEVGPTGEQIGNMNSLTEMMEEIAVSRM